MKARAGYDYLSVWFHPGENESILVGIFNPVQNNRQGAWKSNYWSFEKSGHLRYEEEKQRGWYTTGGWLAKDRVSLVTIEVPEDFSYWIILRSLTDEQRYQYEVLFQPKIQKCHGCQKKVDAWCLTETQKTDDGRERQMLCGNCRTVWKDEQDKKIWEEWNYGL